MGSVLVCCCGVGGAMKIEQLLPPFTLKYCMVHDLSGCVDKIAAS